MKTNFKNKKAFTLIELLIVIAIIGILFIVLVSKVDFATDKSKATGVQTDFRSYQVALEQVAKENSGFNTFGWDVCDTNGNRVRDSYDVGDLNQNGKQDEGEIFIGRKEYGEDFAGIYTLTNPADVTDLSAVRALEAAINANLDPKLHIVINDDMTIVMANAATDPWKNEYHGRYLSNAGADGMDRGAIFIYSKGANGDNGSADGIAEGLVNITTPNNNVTGQDDYVLATFYTYANGYGEVQTITKGFSQNQEFNDASNVDVTPSTSIPVIPGYLQPVVRKNEYGLYLNRAYYALMSGNEGLSIIFKEDGTFEMFLVGQISENVQIEIPFLFLLLMEGGGSNNLEEIYDLLNSFKMTYTMDENGIMLNITDGNNVEGSQEPIPFDPETQTLDISGGGDGPKLTLTNIKNGNVHMYHTYKSLDEAVVPNIKPYPDGTWKSGDGEIVPDGILSIKDHMIFITVPNENVTIPVGWMSIDGKDMFFMLGGEDFVGQGPNGEIIPTWTVR